MAASQKYSNGGEAPCLECHESEKILGILKTPHANRDDADAPMARQQCESCHGASATHIEFPMQVGNTRFGRESKTPAKEQNAACLECHEEGARANWKMGPHGMEDTPCGSCHSIHRAKDPILDRAAQAASCTESCHSAITTSTPPDAPHKVGMDGLTCTDCHNPHGPLDLTSCLTCHPQAPEDLAKEPPKARGYHERAIAKKVECTSCHKGIVHDMPTIDLSGPRGFGSDPTHGFALSE